MGNVNINTRRRRSEEAERRRALRQRAESLVDRRPQFIRYMQDQGMSREEVEHELERLEELTDGLHQQAEEGPVDEHENAPG